MVRASGTEPLVRVYTDSKSAARAQELLETGISAVENALKEASA